MKFSTPRKLEYKYGFQSMFLTGLNNVYPCNAYLHMNVRQSFMHLIKKAVAPKIYPIINMSITINM